MEYKSRKLCNCAIDQSLYPFEKIIVPVALYLNICEFAYTLENICSIS